MSAFTLYKLCSDVGILEDELSKSGGLALVDGQQEAQLGSLSAACELELPVLDYRRVEGNHAEKSLHFAEEHRIAVFYALSLTIDGVTCDGLLRACGQQKGSEGHEMIDLHHGSALFVTYNNFLTVGHVDTTARRGFL